MNGNTRDAIKEFADAVSELAQGTIHMIGVDSATRIVDAAEALKKQLDSDETILD